MLKRTVTFTGKVLLQQMLMSCKCTFTDITQQ